VGIWAATWLAAQRCACGDVCLCLQCDHSRRARLCNPTLPACLHVPRASRLTPCPHPNLSCPALPCPTEVIYVAGDRVVTDALCKPFSMGRNLFCVHSKVGG
jgi:hypothetical protein